MIQIYFDVEGCPLATVTLLLRVQHDLAREVEKGPLPLGVVRAHSVL